MTQLVVYFERVWILNPVTGPLPSFFEWMIFLVQLYISLVSSGKTSLSTTTNHISLQSDDIPPTSFESCMSFLQASIWQFQYIALSIIHQQVELRKLASISTATEHSSKVSSSPKSSTLPASRNPPMSETKNHRASIAKLSKMKPSKLVDKSFNRSSSNEKMSQLLSPIKDRSLILTSSSTSKLTSPSHQLRTRNWIEDLFHTGTIRMIVWLQLHTQPDVRRKAHAILGRILSNDERFSLTKLNDTAFLQTAERWINFVEQGFLIVVESISRGIVVSSGQIFPEQSIRSTATEMVDFLADLLVTDLTVRSRLMNALVYSGNIKLRLNIFSALLCLCRQRPQLRQLLWDYQPKESHLLKRQAKEPKLLIVSGKTIDLDPKQINAISAMINEICSSDQLTLRSILRILIEESMIKLTSHHHTVHGLLSCVDDSTNELNPTVWIRDKDALTKMLCPKLRIIAGHSAIIKTTILSATEDSPAILEGSYKLWQEVNFSLYPLIFIMFSNYIRAS
jgi:hypothetical protein